MSRPFKLSGEQLAQIPARIAAGESRAALAREFRVTHGAICYHVNGGKSSRLGLPWTRPLAEAHDALKRRDLREASAAFDEVSRLLVEAYTNQPAK